MVTAARKYLSETGFLLAPLPTPLALLVVKFTRPNNNGARVCAKKAVAAGAEKTMIENLLKFNFQPRIISAFPDSALV